MNFNLSSLHISALLIALMLSTIVSLSVFGFSKSVYGTCKALVFGPFILCAISIMLPFNIVMIINYILLARGMLLGIRTFSKNNIFLIDIKRNKLLIFTLFYLFCHGFGALVLDGEGAVVDAMTYHLGAGKEWAMYLNGPHLNILNPESLTGSYFEYIHYSLFLAIRPLLILLLTFKETHYEFAMYTILLYGQMFCAILSYVLIPYLFMKTIIPNKNLKTWCLLILVIFGMKNMTWTWRTAKNDMYPLLCFLVGYAYLLKNKIFPAGLAFGIALASKLTNLYPFVLIIIYLISEYRNVLIQRYKEKIIFKEIAIFALGGVIGVLPFLLRNYIETSNPLYPTSSKIFENIYLTDATDAFHKLYSHPTTWLIAYTKFKTLLLANPILILIIGYSLYAKKYLEPILFIIFAIIISKITGERFVWRQISLLIFFIALWFVKLNTHYEGKKFGKEINYIFAVIILCFAQFKPERVYKNTKHFFTESLSSQMPTQYHAWDNLLEENLSGKDLEKHKSNESSYLSRYPHLNLTDSREEFR